MSHRLTAILEFDTGALRELLQLPETAEIIDCRMDFGYRGRLQLKIEGAGFPTQEGHAIQPATCVITERHNADGSKYVERIEWPFGTDVGAVAPTISEEVARLFPTSCVHEWVANSGAGGTPVFHMNRQMSTEPLMHVICSKCNTRTWVTSMQYYAEPQAATQEN